VSALHFKMPIVRSTRIVMNFWETFEDVSYKTYPEFESTLKS